MKFTTHLIQGYGVIRNPSDQFLGDSIDGQHTVIIVCLSFTRRKGPYTFLSALAFLFLVNQVIRTFLDVRYNIDMVSFSTRLFTEEFIIGFAKEEILNEIPPLLIVERFQEEMVENLRADFVSVLNRV